MYEKQLSNAVVAVAPLKTWVPFPTPLLMKLW